MTKRWYRVLPVLLLLLLAGLPAMGAGLEERVVERTLRNGMRLLMVERHSSPTIAAWIRFKVGSVDERSDERGVAHLLEHMLFKGTKTLGTTDYAAEKPLLDQIEATAQALIHEKAKREKGDPVQIEKLERWLADLEKSASRFVVKEEFADIYARNGGTGLQRLYQQGRHHLPDQPPGQQAGALGGDRVGPDAECGAPRILHGAERGDGGAAALL